MIKCYYSYVKKFKKCIPSLSLFLLFLPLHTLSFLSKSVVVVFKSMEYLSLLWDVRCLWEGFLKINYNALVYIYKYFLYISAFNIHLNMPTSQTTVHFFS